MSRSKSLIIQQGEAGSHETSRLTLAEAAVALREKEYSVVPGHKVLSGGKCSCGNPKCTSPGKHPAIRWQSFATQLPSIGQVERWWEDDPDANICLITGKVSDLCVVDIDSELGLQSLMELGMPLENMPETPMVRTGKGYHLYFRFPPEDNWGRTRTGVIPYVDIRGTSGLVIAPPSYHVSGRNYEWLKDPFTVEVSGDFDWERLMSGEKGIRSGFSDRRGKGWFQELLNGVEEGGRNDTATRLAGRYFSLGMVETEVQLILHAWNEQNDPPLAAKEIDSIVKSIGAKNAQELEERELSYKPVTEPEEIRQEYLEKISRAIEIKVLSITKISGEVGRWMFEFENGKAVMDTGQLCKQNTFQKEVFDSTGVVPRERGKTSVPTWDRFLNWCDTAANKIDAGEEATEIGETRHIIQAYLFTKWINDKEVPDRDDPFVIDDDVWFSLTSLADWANNTYGGNQFNMKQLSQRLKVMGAKNKEFRTKKGKRRVAWGLSTEVIGDISENIYQDEKD